MKTLIMSLLPVLLLTACSKNNTDAVTKPDTAAALGSGNWVISSYTQRAEDKTAQFANIVFTFSGTGSVSALRNGVATTGTWFYAPSAVAYYGGAPSSASFTFNLGNSSPFNRLARTWNVSTATDNKISLVNPEPNDDEHITFSKQ